MKRRLSLAMLTVAAAALCLQLVAPAWAVRTHRYSFTTDGTDSDGGPSWSPNGGATFSGGQVQFDGVDGFLSLSASPLPASGAVSIEVWGTYDPMTPVGSRILDFSNASGSNFLYLTPRATPGTPQGFAGEAPLPVSNTRWRWDDDATQYLDIGPMATGTSNTGQEVLLTLVFDPNVVDPTLGNGQFQLYRDGLLVATDSAESLPILSSLATTVHRLGHGVSVPPIGPNAVEPFVNDLPAFLQGSVNELRVYNNVLGPVEILTNLIAGPDDVNGTSLLTGKTWNTGTSNWNTGGNWMAAGVPTVADRATIGNGGTATVTGDVPQVGAITIANGTLSISGGSLSAKFPIQLDTGASNSATVNVTGGGVLEIGGIVPQASTGAKTITVDGGTIRPGFKSALVSSGATTVIGAGGATFDTPSTASLTWASDLSGSGNVTKTGAGTLRLRPSNLGAGLAEQNPDFSGEFFIDEGAVDVQREHGVFGTAGSTQGGVVHLNNATLVINTANPIGFRKEFPADLVVTGDNLVQNMVDREATEIRLQGSLSGDGTIRFVKPVLAGALGIDLENRPDPTGMEGDPLIVDNSNFTGRFIADGNWAVRFRGTLLDPDMTPMSGDEVLYDTTDLPNAIFEFANGGGGQRAGKRGSDANQVIRLGGVAGGGPFDDAGFPGVKNFGRLLASIAGPGDPLASMTYQIGGASEDADFLGSVQNGDQEAAWGTDIVSVVKVGDNVQAFSGPNTYSGTTTVDGGTLLVNGRHSIDARELFEVVEGEDTFFGIPAPVDAPATIGNYTVNAGGKLGGTGLIGSEAYPINVNAVGGTVNPGASVGTLTVEGGVSFDAASHFEVEILDNMADLLIADSLNVTSGATLDVLPLGGVTAGDYVIAQFGSGSGMFDLNAPAGFSVSYATAGQIILTAPNISVGLPGDYNGDGWVDAADYTVWRDNLGAGDESALNGNGDGMNGVDGGDYTLWVNNFGSHSGSGSGALSDSGAVPEPASLALSLLGAVALLGISRRRQ